MIPRSLISTFPSLSLLCLSLSLFACASLFGFPTYYDPTTYQRLTDLKPEVLFLYDSFTADVVNEAAIVAVRLKLAQVYEYEKGKGEKNREMREQVEILQQMFERHVADRKKNGKRNIWSSTHATNQKTNIAEAFDLTISTERSKNKNK